MSVAFSSVRTCVCVCVCVCVCSFCVGEAGTDNVLSMRQVFQSKTCFAWYRQRRLSDHVPKQHILRMMSISHEIAQAQPGNDYVDIRFTTSKYQDLAFHSSVLTGLFAMSAQVPSDSALASTAPLPLLPATAVYWDLCCKCPGCGSTEVVTCENRRCRRSGQFRDPVCDFEDFPCCDDCSLVMLQVVSATANGTMELSEDSEEPTEEEDSDLSSWPFPDSMSEDEEEPQTEANDDEDEAMPIVLPFPDGDPEEFDGPIPQCVLVRCPFPCGNLVDLHNASVSALDRCPYCGM